MPKTLHRDDQITAERLAALPLRAIVAFAVRGAKRVEVLARLGCLWAEAVAAGFDPRAGMTERRLALARVAPHALRRAAAATRAGVSADPAVAAAGDGDAAADAAADAADLHTLSALHLGEPGTLGEPILWDDPRLGPLWPDGPPAWYVEAEAACRELEEKLRPPARPAPGGEAETPDYIASQLADRAWLDGQRNAGALDGYRGEYVVAAKREVLAHHRNLLRARRAAEKKAAEGGIPAEWLTDYFVPSH